MRKIYDPVLLWALQPWKTKEGKVLYFLNKYYKGRVTGKITMSLRELKNLKRFMAERKIT